MDEFWDDAILSTLIDSDDAEIDIILDTLKEEALLNLDDEIEQKFKDKGEIDAN